MTLILGALLALPAMFGTYLFFKMHRDPGWGRRADTFPILVLTPAAGGNHRANIVFKGELDEFLAKAGDYTFVVPNAERESISQQIDAMRSEEGGAGKFQTIALNVDDRPGDSQRIHLIACPYDDDDNQSWYVAHPKTIEPIYHRYTVSPGVGMAAAFMTPVVISVVAPIAAFLMILRRRFRSSPPPDQSSGKRLVRRGVIALVAFSAIMVLAYQDSDQPFGSDAARIGGSAVLLVAFIAAFWWPGMSRIRRAAVTLGGIGIAVALLAAAEHGVVRDAVLAVTGIGVALLFIVVAAFVGNALYEALSAI